MTASTNDVAEPKTLGELEFDRIVAEVGAHCSCKLGRLRVEKLRPTADRKAVEAELAAVDEARRLLRERSIRFHTPLEQDFLQKAGLAGLILEPEQLIGLRDTYETVAECHAVAGELEETYPRILVPARDLPYHLGLHRDLGRVFNAKGEIADEASPELATLRRHQRSLKRRIEHALDRLLRSPERAKSLAEDYFTVVNDRYVVLVKADHKGKIPGIVQGESASGLSLYVEPLEVVEANNEAIETRVEESREIRRILRTLSDHVHTFRQDYAHLFDTLSWLDSVAARARYADETSAILPTFRDDMTLKAFSARHPLLGSRCVPIELVVENDRVVVLSGVNSGGKTVALKTIGLLAAMAQSGLHIPAADHTQLPFFDRIASEIGDQQSIHQNLSSFSSHASHIGHILTHLGSRNLLLFDEFMTGTDPEEGAALAEAILADLAARDTITIVTTHYGSLKALPKKYDRFMNVAAEFDWDRLVPTFRLIPDVPGSSLGIDIAGRFGIPGSLIESARTLVDTGKAALNSMVVELEEELGKVRKEREELESTASKARREREEQQQKLDQLQRARLAELEALKEAQIEEMETLKQVAHEALRAGPTPALPSLIQDQIRRTQAELVAAQPPPPAGLAAGDWVKVLHMKDPGMILEIRPDKKKAVVLVNGIQVKTDLASLERTKAPAKAARAATSTGPTYRLQERDLPTELNLISLRTDEALEQLATYLDAVVARSYPEVRIVHGKGTGALRSAVEKYLKKCRFIKGYRPGSYGEGESGVTIVTLK